MKKENDFTGIWCFIVLAIGIIAICIIVGIFTYKHETLLNKSREECRKLWGYIETFYKNNDIMCWDREWKELLFRK